MCCCRASKDTYTERLLTHNVLANEFATREVFSQIDPRFLAQEHRFRCFMDEIESRAPSLVFLQESSLVEFPRLKAAMSELGFVGIQQKRATPVPLAAFWKKSRFKLTWFEERSRVLICQFLHGATSKTVYTLNCHLQGAPDELASLTRVSQLHNALRRLQLRLQSTGERPEDAKILVVGDFNSQAEDAPARFLRQGLLDASLESTTHQHVDEHGHLTDVIVHPFDFVEAFEVFDRVPQFSHIHNGQGTRVDFVWSQGVKLEGALDVLGEGETWSSERARGWPSETRCSDHACLEVQFCL